MDLKDQVKKMDEMVSQGDILNAISEFFSDDASTSDYSDVKTEGKAQMIEKMNGFFGAIANVNAIMHHRTMLNENASASEFTFDFDMNDGSRIFWHEIIRRVWNEEGKVIEEEYFDAQN
jgi:hypothetical protein